MNRVAIYSKFQQNVCSIKFSIFLFLKLPSAWFSGVKVKKLNLEECATSVPYKWFSQNPFQSTYFACQAMAAELSTGLPALMAIEKRNPGFSMLVVDMQAKYTKKAVGLTTFTCKDVDKIIRTVDECEKTGEASTVSVETIGLNNANEEISRFVFTWSFKQKSVKK
jgi:hypothetical protein